MSINKLINCDMGCHFCRYNFLKEAIAETENGDKIGEKLVEKWVNLANFCAQKYQANFAILKCKGL